jgi:hypothetical protein
MMQHLAIVTSVVSFFRSLGGIVGLTLMSSVVNNKVAAAFSFLSNSSSAAAASSHSLDSIDSLPPAILTLVQHVFSDAIRWAYIALLPFVCIAAISSFFLREVKIERSASDEAKREKKRQAQDAELGQVMGDKATENGGEGGQVVKTHRERITVIGPGTGIVWLVQAAGDRYGWRK